LGLGLGLATGAIIEETLPTVGMAIRDMSHRHTSTIRIWLDLMVADAVVGNQHQIYIIEFNDVMLIHQEDDNVHTHLLSRTCNNLNRLWTSTYHIHLCPP